MRAISRHAAVFAASLFAVAACGSADGGDESTAPSSTAAVTHEMVMGDEDAPVTLVEYASWTCAHCLQFRNDVVDRMEEEYVETGKVKFVFREYPTAPANISVAGFAVARCAGEDKYFDVVNELFDRQAAFISIAREGGQVKAALQQVAANHGITDPAEFDACLQDSDIRKAIAASVAKGEADGVTGTPSILINGQQPAGYQWRSWDGMQAALDEALGEDSTDTAAPDGEEMTGENDTSGESAESEETETGSEMVEPTSGEAQPE